MYRSILGEPILSQFGNETATGLAIQIEKDMAGWISPVTALGLLDSFRL